MTAPVQPFSHFEIVSSGHYIVTFELIPRARERDYGVKSDKAFRILQSATTSPLIWSQMHATAYLKWRPQVTKICGLIFALFARGTVNII